MRGLVLDQVAKGFEGVVAVDGLDLEIPPGEVYGLLGPNGAGKTTTIRMILGILEPDTGTIACGENGEVLSPDRVGYLPEERGLYPKMKVMDLLVFLGRIKSLPRSEAQDRAEIWLDRFDLQEWAKRPVEHLSKGMQQKVQFIATVMHDPDLLILDEPFSGLDPINAALFQDVLTELKVESKILILSTHQMEDAERLCDRVCLINRGTKVLDGPMADVKASFGSDRVRISFEGDDALLTDTSIVRSVETRERFLEVQLQPGSDPQELLRRAMAAGKIRRFELADPSLRDIFLTAVRSAGGGAPPMNKALTIIAREYVAIVRKKSFLIGLVVVPLILVIALFLPILMMMMKVEKQQRLALIDRTGLLHEEFVSQLDGKLKDDRPRYVIRTIAQTSEPEALQDTLVSEISGGKLDALLVIPADVFDGSEATYYGRSVGNLDEHRRLRSVLTEAVVAHRLGEQGLDPDKVREWTKRVELKTVKIAKGKQRKTGFAQEYFGSFGMAMLLYFVLIIFGVTVMRGVMEEKSSRMVEVLLSSVRPEQLMIGKIVGVGAAGLTQIGVWIGVAAAGIAYRTLKTGSDPPFAVDAGTVAAFGVFFLLGFLLYASMYAMIGSIYSSEQEAQNVQLLVVLPLMVPLLSIVFVTKAPDVTLSIVLSMIPFFSPILMFTRINVLTPPVHEIVASILILAATVAGAMWMAARIYRVGMLMQGKRATLPEIVRWVRRG